MYIRITGYTPYEDRELKNDLERAKLSNRFLEAMIAAFPNAKQFSEVFNPEKISGTLINSVIKKVKKFDSELPLDYSKIDRYITLEYNLRSDYKTLITITCSSEIRLHVPSSSGYNLPIENQSISEIYESIECEIAALERVLEVPYSERQHKANEYKKLIESELEKLMTKARKDYILPLDRGFSSHTI